jgi:hypothetical protein
VKLIGEGVDHRNIGILGKGFQFLLVVGANGNHIQVAGEDAGRILQGLAAAHLHHRRHQIEGAAPALGHGCRKTGAGAGRSFLKQQPQHPTPQLHPIRIPL